MKRFLIIAIFALVALGVWYASWRSAMSPHVAFVERNIVEANKRYKTPNYRATIEYKSIRPAGFPFGHSVIIEAPSINMIQANETYSIRTDLLRLTFEDANQRRYKLEVPSIVTALYAVANAAPENYSVDVASAPAVWLRVQGDKPGCRGEQCLPSPDALWKEIGIELPPEILLNAHLGKKTRPISFRQQAYPMPIFIPLPENISRPVFLFVGMLREALVYNTPGNEPINTP